MHKWNKIAVILLALSQVSHVQANGFESSANLKTLFTTPLERKQLDEMRDSGKFSKQQGNDNPASSIHLPLTIDVRGVVIREVGKPVVWVNDGNTLKSEKIDDSVRVRIEYINSEPVSIPVRVNQKTLKMKPGQQWQEFDSKIKEKYQIKEEKSLLSGIAE